MDIGKVVGNVWATRKDEKLCGQKLLVVKILKLKTHTRKASWLQPIMQEQEMET